MSATTGGDRLYHVLRDIWLDNEMPDFQEEHPRAVDRATCDRAAAALGIAGEAGGGAGYAESCPLCTKELPDHAYGCANGCAYAAGAGNRVDALEASLALLREELADARDRAGAAEARTHDRVQTLEEETDRLARWRAETIAREMRGADPLRTGGRG